MGIYLRRYSLAEHQIEKWNKMSNGGGWFDPDTENNKALDTYSDGWAKGSSDIIYSILNEGYFFSGLPNMDPVGKEQFKAFWEGFRSNVEQGGGPPTDSTDFMTFKNVIRRKVGDGIVEAGQWEVPGFANGLYMSLAQGGKIWWEEATM